MTKEEFAQLLDGREYGYEITREESSLAKENGLVVVFGYSDDCTEFRGAIYEEVGEGELCFTNGGEFPDNDDLAVLKKYGFADQVLNNITSNYSRNGWTFETDIPHSIFKIMEDGAVFGEGIVFSINDLK